MTDNSPKISFIPKSSLVRGGSFMEGKRPRSVMRIIAVFAAVLSASSYAALYFYGDFLTKETKKMNTEIIDAQRMFSQSPEVEKARLFQARVDVVRELLDSHIIVSPIFDFLSQSTAKSILYNNFSLKRDAGGTFTLELKGEAPNYASLAYQSDVLREKNKELSGFSIENVALTNLGTVNFTIKAVVSNEYISYMNKSRGGVNASTGSDTKLPTPKTGTVNSDNTL